MSFEKTLNDTDLRILTAAMYSLTADSESLGAVLLPENHPAALTLSGRLEAETNLRSERAKAIASSGLVPLTHVGRGSIWEWNVNGCERTGCMWPEPEGFAECSYCSGGPMWAPADEVVSILAHGLSTLACEWVLSAKDDDTDIGLNNERVRRRCAHLMAGGSIESYVEPT